MSKKEQPRFEQVPASTLYVMVNETIEITVPARNTEQYANWTRDRDE